MLLKNVKVHWARILGKPSAGFDKDDRMQDRWSMDLSLNDEQVNELSEVGLNSKIQNRGDDRGNFIQMIKKAHFKDRETGEIKNTNPIRVVDHRNQPWNEKELIGNGSILNVSFDVVETSYGKKTFLKPQVKAVQVWDLEKYTPKSEFPTRSIDTSEDAAQAETWE